MQIRSYALSQAPRLKPTSSPQAAVQHAPSLETDSVQDTASIQAVDSRRQPKLVDVGHFRELRGAWVASVWNINFPSSSQLDKEAQQQEIVKTLDTLQECGFNSIFFQVRPEGDALYSSQLEPWSSALTGTQGKDPGYDPLQTMIKEARKRNIEVHAWLNPFRAKAASPNQVHPHIAVTNPEDVHPYGANLWMDPGSDAVQKKLVDVCNDLLDRYDLDGLHFDDYFYPYPNGADFPDEATWQKYKAGGGELSRADWRRDNVNRAVQSVDQAVDSHGKHVRFGISPFGIPAPDKPEGIHGFDQYNGLYADTQKWMDQGWVDYLAPQLYWPTTKRGQEYEPLVKWWNEHSSGGRAIFAGNNLASLGSNSSWTKEEYKKQVELSREHAGAGGAGNLWWHVGPLLENRQNVQSLFKDDLYTTPALSPPLPGADKLEVAPPDLSWNNDKLRLVNQDAQELKAYTVYRKEGQEWKLDRILPPDEPELTLAGGEWAIAAVNRQGIESKGVVIAR